MCYFLVFVGISGKSCFFATSQLISKFRWEPDYLRFLSDRQQTGLKAQIFSFKNLKKRCDWLEWLLFSLKFIPFKISESKKQNIKNKILKRHLWWQVQIARSYYFLSLVNFWNGKKMVWVDPDYSKLSLHIQSNNVISFDAHLPIPFVLLTTNQLKINCTY